MKIFLTGASGYVGAVIAEKLQRRGYKVTGLARSEKSAEKLREKRIEPLLGDLEGFVALQKGAGEADAVIHTAFSHNFSDYNDAVKLDRNVISIFAETLAQTNKPLIVTSSSAVLGDTRSSEADEDYPFDQNSSRLLRGEVERDVLQLSSKGIRSIVLRLPLFVYGRAGSSFVPFMIKQAKLAGSANYIGTGAERVSAIHVEDAAEIYVTALEKSTAKGLYNVAAESVTLKELNEAIAGVLHIQTKSISIEKGKEQFGKMFEFLSKNNQLSSEKARRDLEWSPNAYTTILEDIEHGSYLQSLESEVLSLESKKK